MGNKVIKRPDQKLTDAEIVSIMETTSFSRSEILAWHEGFIVWFVYLINNACNYDRLRNFALIIIFSKRDCPSGRLNKQKFIDVYKVFYPNGKAEKFCNHVFRVFDLNGQGDIVSNKQYEMRKFYSFKYQWSFELNKFEYLIDLIIYDRLLFSWDFLMSNLYMD